MQKGNAPFISQLNDDEHKKNLLNRKNVLRTIDKMLWDSDWLKKIYPERFDNYYHKEDLQDDQYDTALYNK